MSSLIPLLLETADPRPSEIAKILGKDKKDVERELSEGAAVLRRAREMAEEERGCTRQVVPHAEDGKEGQGGQQDLTGAGREAGRDRLRLGLDHDDGAAVGREL